MGGQQSKGAASSLRTQDKLLVNRLRQAKLHDGSATSSRETTNEKTNEKTATYEEAIVRDAEPLALDVVAAIPARLLEDPRNRLALSALSSANPRTVLTSQASQITHQHLFNTKIPSEGAPVTNQRSSGRCWLFAATNVFRVALMNRYNVESFELSQNYLYYYDKLEKSNWFLEQIIDTAGEDLEGRLVQRLLGDLVSDGGQWDMVYNLVDKYGLVPQALYPDSWNAKNSSVLNAVLRTKLREFALTLRGVVAEGGGGGRDPTSAVLSALKADMMKEIQHILTLLLGPTPDPTAEFQWTYVDKDDKVHELSITPRDFARTVSSSGFQMMASSLSLTSSSSSSWLAIADMVSLVNDPRNEYMKPLTVDRLGNVVGGRNTTYLNVDMETIKTACVKMIRAGSPVFFGCDVGKFSDKASGIMDLAIFDYEAGLRTDLLGMTKEQRLRAGESLMTHAMVLTAVHLDDRTGRPLRWRVQNSWGTDSGDKGWFVMSDAWMDEWVYQAVVDPRLLSREVRDVLGQEPVVLPLWDPMGALA
ncbi:hypothetical protein E4U42_005934 [Claviceps africana]|uniref:Cysteine proteinase 1, mitochondrial n=1 Tax=Claviceps africana TaxID=83212 RepID=A0A8K0J309_9HYPO|nr:hypothetical protein E4U42_005934 [Claviceps africana]